MNIFTEEFIRSIAPRARADYVGAWVGVGEAVLTKWGFNTMWRQCHFLTQVLHETGGFTIVRESMSYTSASRIHAVWPSRFSVSSAAAYIRNPQALAENVYGSRMGNERNGVGDGDGYRYRGGGAGQLTGYDNYLRVGRKICVDLAAHPELIEQAPVSLEAAACEYAEFLKYADMGEKGLRAFSNGVNRGAPMSSAAPIGWDERQAAFKVVAATMGMIGGADDVLEPGEHSASVRLAQNRLNALGYVCGNADGSFGKLTVAAVLAFQAENELPTNGVLDAAARAVLYADAAKPKDIGERATATIADIKGDKSISTADSIVKVGQLTVGTAAAVETAKQVDVLTGVSKSVGEIGLVKSLFGQIGDLAAWALSHWWIAAIVAGFALWRWGSKIKAVRLIEHRLGINIAPGQPNVQS